MRINEKDQQIEKCEELILMSVQNIYFGETPFYFWNIIVLDQILRALLSNNNAILHF